MTALRPLLLVPAVCTVVAVPIARAQDAWQDPAPPCVLEAGHDLVAEGREQLISGVGQSEEDRRARDLDQAYERLTRAIRDEAQDANPAAWYYLGRYFEVSGNVPGADTALAHAARLAPQCAEDVERRRAGLAPDVLADAIRTWQEGKIDSARVNFRLAARLAPRDANVPLFASIMYAERGQLDSAEAYLAAGLDVAGDDPEFGRRGRQAALSLARAYEAPAADQPVLQQVVRSRLRRDSIQTAIADDSTRLARLIDEWSGVNLRPAARQRVQQDSSVLAQRIAGASAARPAAEQAATRDSTAAHELLGPAIRAYERYAEEAPDDASRILKLVRLLATIGHRDAVSGWTAHLASLDDLPGGDLVQTGTLVFNEGHAAQARELLELATVRNPSNVPALYVLARAQAALGQPAQLTATVDRLLALDPLNPQNVRMRALAWSMVGDRDSTRYYVAQADTGIAWAVRVTQFAPSESGAMLNGTVQNVLPRPLAAASLTFEFLDQAMSVIAAQTVAIPALQPGQQHMLSVRIDQGGAAGWRYRRD